MPPSHHAPDGAHSLLRDDATSPASPTPPTPDTRDDRTELPPVFPPTRRYRPSPARKPTPKRPRPNPPAPAAVARAVGARLDFEYRARNSPAARPAPPLPPVPVHALAFCADRDASNAPPSLTPATIQDAELFTSAAQEHVHHAPAPTVLVSAPALAYGGDVRQSQSGPFSILTPQGTKCIATSSCSACYVHTPRSHRLDPRTSVQPSLVRLAPRALGQAASNNHAAQSPRHSRNSSSVAMSASQPVPPHRHASTASVGGAPVVLKQSRAPNAIAHSARSTSMQMAASGISAVSIYGQTPGWTAAAIAEPPLQSTTSKDRRKLGKTTVSPKERDPVGRGSRGTLTIPERQRSAVPYQSNAALQEVRTDLAPQVQRLYPSNAVAEGTKMLVSPPKKAVQRASRAPVFVNGPAVSRAKMTGGTRAQTTGQAMDQSLQASHHLKDSLDNRSRVKESLRASDSRSPFQPEWPPQNDHASPTVTWGLQTYSNLPEYVSFSDSGRTAFQYNVPIVKSVISSSTELPPHMSQSLRGSRNTIHIDTAEQNTGLGGTTSAAQRADTYKARTPESLRGRQVLETGQHGSRNATFSLHSISAVEEDLLSNNIPSAVDSRLPRINGNEPTLVLGGPNSMLISDNLASQCRTAKGGQRGNDDVTKHQSSSELQSIDKDPRKVRSSKGSPKSRQHLQRAREYCKDSGISDSMAQVNDPDSRRMPSTRRHSASRELKVAKRTRGSAHGEELNSAPCKSQSESALNVLEAGKQPPVEDGEAQVEKGGFKLPLKLRVRSSFEKEVTRATGSPTRPVPSPTILGDEQPTAVLRTPTSRDKRVMKADTVQGLGGTVGGPRIRGIDVNTSIPESPLQSKSSFLLPLKLRVREPVNDARRRGLRRKNARSAGGVTSSLRKKGSPRKCEKNPKASKRVTKSGNRIGDLLSGNQLRNSSPLRGLPAVGSKHQNTLDASDETSTENSTLRVRQPALDDGTESASPGRPTASFSSIPNALDTVHGNKSDVGHSRTHPSPRKVLQRRESAKRNTSSKSLPTTIDREPSSSHGRGHAFTTEKQRSSTAAQAAIDAAAPDIILRQIGQILCGLCQMSVGPDECIKHPFFPVRGLRICNPCHSRVTRKGNGQATNTAEMEVKAVADATKEQTVLFRYLVEEMIVALTANERKVCNLEDTYKALRGQDKEEIFRRAKSLPVPLEMLCIMQVLLRSISVTFQCGRLTWPHRSVDLPSDEETRSMVVGALPRTFEDLRSGVMAGERVWKAVFGENEPITSSLLSCHIFEKVLGLVDIKVRHIGDCEGGSHSSCSVCRIRLDSGSVGMAMGKALASAPNASVRKVFAPGNSDEDMKKGAQASHPLSGSATAVCCVCMSSQDSEDFPFNFTNCKECPRRFCSVCLTNVLGSSEFVRALLDEYYCCLLCRLNQNNENDNSVSDGKKSDVETMSRGVPLRGMGVANVGKKRGKRASRARGAPVSLLLLSSSIRKRLLCFSGSPGSDADIRFAKLCEGLNEAAFSHSRGRKPVGPVKHMCLRCKLLVCDDRGKKTNRVIRRHRTPAEEHKLLRCVEKSCRVFMHNRCHPEQRSGKKRLTGMLCPQHKCSVCQMKDEAKLVRCRTCPATYCRDHLPRPCDVHVFSEKLIACASCQDRLHFPQMSTHRATQQPKRTLEEFLGNDMAVSLQINKRQRQLGVENQIAEVEKLRAAVPRTKPRTLQFSDRRGRVARDEVRLNQRNSG